MSKNLVMIAKFKSAFKGYFWYSRVSIVMLLLNNMIDYILCVFGFKFTSFTFFGLLFGDIIFPESFHYFFPIHWCLQNVFLSQQIFMFPIYMNIKFFTIFINLVSYQTVMMILIMRSSTMRQHKLFRSKNFRSG